MSVIYAVDAHALVVDCRGRVPKRLLQIFRLKKRILGEESFTIGIRCKQFQNAADREPHTPKARFPCTLIGFNRYPIKDRFHVVSLDYIGC